MAESTTGTSYSSKSFLWMMVALFSGMAVMLGGGLFLASRVVRTAGLGAANDGNTYHTRLGSLRVEREKQVGPGLPVYPHVELIVPEQDGAMKAAREAQDGITRTIYRTQDSSEFVEKWYLQHLTPEFKRRGPGESVLPEILAKLKIPDDNVAFLAQRDGQLRAVALAEDSTGVQISLIRMDRRDAGAEKPAEQPTPVGPAPPAGQTEPAAQPAQTEQPPAQQP
jgi:hypothetical protein